MKVEEKIRYIAEHNGLEKALDKLAEECAEYAAARIKHNLGEGNGEVNARQKTIISKKHGNIA